MSKIVIIVVLVILTHAQFVNKAMKETNANPSVLIIVWQDAQCLKFVIRVIKDIQAKIVQQLAVQFKTVILDVRFQMFVTCAIKDGQEIIVKNRLKSSLWVKTSFNHKLQIANLH